MAYISQITLPSGTTYEIKDSWARDQIEAITGGSAIVFKGVSSTPLTDGGNENPTVNGTVITVKDTGDLYFYERQEFIYGDDKAMDCTQSKSFIQSSSEIGSEEEQPIVVIGASDGLG